MPHPPQRTHSRNATSAIRVLTTGVHHAKPFSVYQQVNIAALTIVESEVP
ncbi:MAG: hypothetical protein M3Y50_05820 [Acidobacteriota bacterium]|nr:hypothetical protein [Acidobacteriota bacterium]